MNDPVSEERATVNRPISRCARKIPMIWKHGFRNDS